MLHWLGLLCWSGITALTQVIELLRSQRPTGIGMLDRLLLLLK